VARSTRKRSAPRGKPKADKAVKARARSSASKAPRRVSILPDLSESPAYRTPPESRFKLRLPTGGASVEEAISSFHTLSTGAAPASRTAMPSSQWRAVPSADLPKYPHSAIGKLTINYKSGRSIGTAAVIGFNTILTAAHCVASPDHGPAVGLNFQPGFSDTKSASDARSWKIAPAFLAKPHPAWIAALQNKKIDWRYDVAIVRLAPNSAGKVGDVCGRLGIVAGANLSLPSCLFGYPALDNLPDQTLPFDGGDLVESVGPYVGAYWPSAPESPVGVASPMAEGASGGPWIQDYFVGPGAPSRNRIVGLNSFTDMGLRPGCMFTPRFIGAVIPFLQDAIERDKNGLPP
jgi:hypothetical protein